MTGNLYSGSRTVVGDLIDIKLHLDGLMIVDHPHHWLIGRQNGPESEGVCKQCGAVRNFTNGYTRPYLRAAGPSRFPPAQRMGAAD